MRFLSLLFLFNIFLFAQQIGKPFVQLGHSKVIYDIDVYKNKYFATASEDGSIKIWDLKKAKLIRTLTVHTGAVFSVKFDEKFHRLFSGHGHRIRVWNLNGKLLATLNKHKYFVTSIDIDTKNNLLVSASADKSVIVWNLKTLKMIKKIKNVDKYGVNSVKIDSKHHLLFAGGEEGKLKVFSLKNYKLLHQYYIGNISGINISDDKNLLVVSSSIKNCLKILNLNNFKIIKTIKYKSFGYLNGCFKNDNILIINGDIYNWKSDKFIKKISIKSPFTLSDNKKFLITSESIIDLTTYRKTKYNYQNIIGNIEKLKLKNNKLKIYQDNKIITFDIYNAKIDDVKTENFASKKQKIKFLLKYIKNKIDSIDYIDKTILIKATDYNYHNKYTKYGVKSYLYIYQKPKLRTLIVDKFVVSSDKKYLIIYYTKQVGKYKFEYYLEKYDLAKNKIVFNIKLPLNCKTLATDSKKYIAIARKSIFLYDYKNGKFIKKLKNRSNVRALLFDKHFLYVGNADNRVKKWDLKTFKLVKVFLLNSRINTLLKYKNMLVVATENGDIEFLNDKNGKKLAKFIYFKNGEWIVITNDGYFNSSKYGAKYLNVLITPMDVVSIDQFYDQFYRPNMVKSILRGVFFKPKLKLLDIKPAPSIEIVNTPSKTDKKNITITLKIIDQGGGIGNIVLYLNGSAIKTDTRGLLTKSKTIYKKFDIVLKDGINNIKVIAYNKNNTMNSEAVFYKIFANIKSTKPSLYALVIGLNKFKNPKLQLNYAVSDARLFAKVLKNSTKNLFKNINIKILDNYSNTTKEAIIKNIKTFYKINPNDLFVFYIASHGTVDDGKYFLITSNVGSLSLRKLKQSALTQSEIKTLLGNIPATKKVLIFDTCNSGKIGTELQKMFLTRGLNEDTAMKILSRAVGSTVFAASTSTQEALAGYKNHGLFTYVLSSGLQGKADFNHDGFIKTRELADYVDDEVPTLAEKIFKRSQFPTISPAGDAFPIAKINKEDK